MGVVMVREVVEGNLSRRVRALHRVHQDELRSRAVAEGRQVGLNEPPPPVGLQVPPSPRQHARGQPTVERPTADNTIRPPPRPPVTMTC